MNVLVLALDAFGALALGSAVAYGLSVWRSRGVDDDLDDRVRRFAEAGAGLPISMDPGDLEEFGSSPRDRFRQILSASGARSKAARARLE